jgi:hypothetical protein
MNYWRRILLYTFVPAIGFHLLMMPLWFLAAFQQSAKAMSVEMAFDVLLPVYLLKSNYNNSEEFVQFKNYYINAILILFATTISCFLYYTNWAISIGDFLNPDAETLTNTLHEYYVALSIAIVGIVISLFSISRRKAKERTV